VDRAALRVLRTRAAESLEPTSIVLEVNGTKARQWTGTTASGVPVVAFIVAIGVPDTAPAAELEQFQRELRERVATVGRHGLLVFDGSDRDPKKQN
jgi:hypothetical protein